MVHRNEDLGKQFLPKLIPEFGRRGHHNAQLVTTTFNKIDQHAGLVDVLHWSSNKDPWNWPQSIKVRLDAEPELRDRVCRLLRVQI